MEYSISHSSVRFASCEGTWRSLSKLPCARSLGLCHLVHMRSLIADLSGVLTDMQGIEQVFSSMLLMLTRLCSLSHSRELTRLRQLGTVVLERRSQ
jgi:hypothetical protein